MIFDDELMQATPEAVTAQQGFFPSAVVAPAGVDGGLADLQSQLQDLEVRYRGLIDRLPAIVYIDGIGIDDPMVDVSPGIETLFVPTAPQVGHLSSSLIKQIATFGGDVSRLVPKAVHDRLLQLRSQGGSA